MIDQAKRTGDFLVTDEFADAGRVRSIHEEGRPWESETFEP
jgi:hypothetical protein